MKTIIPVSFILCMAVNTAALASEEGSEPVVDERADRWEQCQMAMKDQSGACRSRARGHSTQLTRNVQSDGPGSLRCLNARNRVENYCYQSPPVKVQPAE